jgi:hypothetical protein
MERLIIEIEGRSGVSFTRELFKVAQQIESGNTDGETDTGTFHIEDEGELDEMESYLEDTRGNL